MASPTSKNNTAIGENLAELTRSSIEKRNRKRRDGNHSDTSTSADEFFEPNGTITSAKHNIPENTGTSGLEFELALDATQFNQLKAQQNLNQNQSQTQTQRLVEERNRLIRTQLLMRDQYNNVDQSDAANLNRGNASRNFMHQTRPGQTAYESKRSGHAPFNQSIPERALSEYQYSRISPTSKQQQRRASLSVGSISEPYRQTSSIGQSPAVPFGYYYTNARHPSSSEPYYQQQLHQQYQNELRNIQISSLQQKRMQAESVRPPHFNNTAMPDISEKSPNLPTNSDITNDTRLVYRESHNSLESIPYSNVSPHAQWFLTNQMQYYGLPPSDNPPREFDLRFVEQRNRVQEDLHGYYSDNGQELGDENEFNINWNSDNDQNGVLVVMDSTGAPMPRHITGYYQNPQHPLPSRNNIGTDPMRYLNIVQVEQNAYQHLPSASPLNSAANPQPSLSTQHTVFSPTSFNQQLLPPGRWSPQLIKVPANSNPNSAIIKSQPANIMQRNHLLQMNAAAAAAGMGSPLIPVSPAGIANSSSAAVAAAPSSGGVNSASGGFLARTIRRTRAFVVYLAIILAAWYVKDPAGMKLWAKRARKVGLAYIVLLFGNNTVAPGNSDGEFGRVLRGGELNWRLVFELLRSRLRAIFEAGLVGFGRVAGLDIERERKRKTIKEYPMKEETDVAELVDLVVAVVDDTFPLLPPEGADQVMVNPLPFPGAETQSVVGRFVHGSDEFLTPI
ncbi:hypothetical protein HK100_008502 [Physocladia obscura]|uniref:Uncharacterized protein n=1 Tax=Physocladia obscura TaxID=109957 RepID=A0AAD5T9W8_9FUNG|nr:hypothetical protein HK100_008502 [Physocladia obscura]